MYGKEDSVTGAMHVRHFWRNETLRPILEATGFHVEIIRPYKTKLYKAPSYDEAPELNLLLVVATPHAASPVEQPTASASPVSSDSGEAASRVQKIVYGIKSSESLVEEAQHQVRELHDLLLKIVLARDLDFSDVLNGLERIIETLREAGPAEIDQFRNRVSDEPSAMRHMRQLVGLVMLTRDGKKRTVDVRDSFLKYIEAAFIVVEMEEVVESFLSGEEREFHDTLEFWVQTDSTLFTAELVDWLLHETGLNLERRARAIEAMNILITAGVPAAIDQGRMARYLSYTQDYWDRELQRAIAEARRGAEGSGSSPVSSLSLKKPGGIDFNPNHVDLSEEGDEIQIRFSASDLQNLDPQSITGILPVIIHITPLPSVLPLLGLAPKREDEIELSQAG